MSHIDIARQALGNITIKGLSVTIFNKAIVDTRNQCVFFVEAILTPTKPVGVTPRNPFKYAEKALWNTDFPRDSEGYEEVSVRVKTPHQLIQDGKGSVLGEVCVQYSWTGVNTW